MNKILHHNESCLSSREQQEERIWKLLEQVFDPEVPVLSIIDLGIVRKVVLSQYLDSTVEITITPTYSGCPAMDMISMNIKMHLLSYGYRSVKIISVLSPAWTTEWMTDSGKKNLQDYGIAAPYKLEQGLENLPPCPQCASPSTRLLSQFGSTACKALYQCNDCKEPFDYFKCH
ncbi:MAG: 1,2-phenylacetyl-CoA epoxidase subunit PaaD [Ferruginibacter sp.]